MINLYQGLDRNQRKRMDELLKARSMPKMEYQTSTIIRDPRGIMPPQAVPTNRTPYRKDEKVN